MSHVYQNGSDVSHVYNGCSTHENSSSVIALKLKAKKKNTDLNYICLFLNTFFTPVTPQLAEVMIYGISWHETAVGFA